MKNILTIIKKEFSRFFKDKRMIITVLLPGLLIYIVYSIMGTVMNSVVDGGADEITAHSSYVVNMPENLSAVFGGILEVGSEITEEEAHKKVEEGELDLLIVFPENFEEALAGSAENVPDVKIIYNSSVESSFQGYIKISSLLEGLKKPVFTINRDGDADLAGQKESAGKMLAMFMPMLMFALLVSGCIAVAPEAIAGEKERGTLATILITPVKRWQLALGKIISLTCFALLSGISSFLGVILSLPKLMGSLAGGDLAIYYALGDYLMIFGLIISATLVIISAFSVLSAFAKSVKEAGTLIMPLMILIIILGVVSMVVSHASIGLYAIPLLGCELAMSSVFTFTITPAGFALAVISNLILAAVFVVVLSFMFRSERIMFNK